MFGVKGEVKAHVVDEVAKTIDVILLFVFVEDYFEVGVVKGQSLDSQVTVDTDELPWHYYKVRHFQGNNCIVVN